MIYFFNFIKRNVRLSVFVMVCVCLLFASLLFADEQNYAPPQQQYADNEVKVTRLIFSKPTGFYDEPFTLMIKAPTKEIYYTLDGSEPARGQEGTFRYEGGIEIGDATPNENVYSMRTDVTTGFDLDAVNTRSKGRRVMNYKTPDYPVDKCTILRAAFYTIDDERSEVETASYFVGYKGREGYGDVKVLSVVTDPAGLFDYEKGIYVTGRTYDDFAAADPFENEEIWYRHFWWWWDANYHNDGKDWEREANIQFFSEDGDLILQQQAGIRIQGGGSRGFLPKSLNLYARKCYDGSTRFHYDFFDTGYLPKRLTLTCGGDDYYTKQKDRLVSELAADQGFATMHYEPCILFLDGEFWGFYFLTEKYDEKYFNYYYNVPEEEVLIVKNHQVEQGVESDQALYDEMRSFIEENDMSAEENYKKACELIDMDSFINYYAALIYCGRCGDWPNGNCAMWRTREAPAEENASDGSSGNSPDTSSEKNSGGTSGKVLSSTAASGSSGSSAQANRNIDDSESSSTYRDGRWRWILFDVNSDAISSELSDHDTLRYAMNANKMKMFGSLCDNPDFRKKFEKRILEYGSTIFTPQSVNRKVDEYAEEMTAPMAIHFRRFFGSDSGLNFTEITDTEIRGFFTDRYSVIKQSLESNFGKYED